MSNDTVMIHLQKDTYGRDFYLESGKSVASVAASGVLAAASGVVCNRSLFSLEIAFSTQLLTSDGARAKTSVSLINQVALVGQQHEDFDGDCPDNSYAWCLHLHVQFDWLHLLHATN